MPRETRQRQAIRAVIERARRPLGPGEILAMARARVPGIGLATVYRTLKSLVDEGWLVAVELPGEPPQYERAGLEHHHHFRCRECRRTYEVVGCPGNLKSLTPPGFRLEGHELLLYGTCAACARAG